VEADRLARSTSRAATTSEGHDEVVALLKNQEVFEKTLAAKEGERRVSITACSPPSKRRSSVCNKSLAKPTSTHGHERRVERDTYLKTARWRRLG